MKKFIGLATLSALGLTVVVVVGSASVPRGSAAGTGGTISLGAIVGNTLEVNTTAPANAYSGFNLHVHSGTSAGVTLTSIDGSNSGTILSTVGNGSDIFCASGSALPERVYACAGLAGQAILTGGLLATFMFNATGNGCIVVNLVHVSGDPTLDTYTVDANTVSVQSNTVSAAKANILVGSGTLSDCGGIATSTPTQPVATSTPSDTPTSTPPTATSTPCAGACPTPLPTNTPSGGYPAPTGNCVLAVATTALVGGQTPITVTVRDANGALVAGATVDLSIVAQPGTDATVTADASVTDALGVVTGTVAVGSTPGLVQVLATAPTGSCGGSIVVSTG